MDNFIATVSSLWDLFGRWFADSFHIQLPRNDYRALFHVYKRLMVNIAGICSLTVFYFLFVVNVLQWICSRNNCYQILEFSSISLFCPTLIIYAIFRLLISMYCRKAKFLTNWDKLISPSLVSYQFLEKHAYTHFQENKTF